MSAVLIVEEVQRHCIAAVLMQRAGKLFRVAAETRPLVDSRANVKRYG
jgi:hypothetical protein